jgi:hypothetical protein
MIKPITLLLYMGILLNSSCAKQTDSDQTTEILFIGSSYFVANDLPALVGEFASLTKKEVFIDEYIPSGVLLWEHANSIQTEVKIYEKDWDYVVLQGVGALTAYPEEYPRAPVLAALQRLDSIITRNCPTTKTVFCMPWAFEDGMTWKEGWTDTYADMQIKVYLNTMDYANEVGLVISPVGAAWFHVLEEKDYPLHYLHLSDWNHPSLRGSYLMACTIFSTLFQVSTVGIPFYAGLPQEEALYFQEVASGVVLNTPGLWHLLKMNR